MRFQQGILGPVQKILLAIAGVVVAVACLTVLITLHQAAERRRRDIAILRSLGAYRSEVATLVFSEGLLLTGAGILLGLLIGHGGMALAADSFRDATGLIINPWRLPSNELIALLTMALSGALASIFPAISCYRRTPIDDLLLTE
jgi:putative ABC transport system permease protein